MATYSLELEGAITPTGALIKEVKKPLAGASTPTSTLLNYQSADYTGATTPTGALIRNITKALAGSSAPASSLLRSTTRILAGSIAPTGLLSAGIGEAPCNLTVADLRARLYDMLDDDGTYYRSSEVLNALNKAQRLFAFLTLCIERTVTFNLTNGQAFYSINDQITDFLCALRVSRGTTRLRPETINSLNLRDSTWRARAGAVVRYAQLGFDLLAVTPQPASGVNTLSLTYAAEPAALTSDISVPEIPGDQQLHLLDYAFWYLRLKEGGQEHANAGQYLQRFLEAAGKYASFVRAKNRAQGYDRMPMDMETFDRSRFEVKLNVQRQKQKRQEKDNQPQG